MSKNLSSSETPTAATREVVTTLFNALQPHAQRAKVFVRGGVTTISLEMPADVKITREHFTAVTTKARGAHCWVEWMDTGLRLCIKLAPTRGSKRKLDASVGSDEQTQLKKHRGDEER